MSQKKVPNPNGFIKSCKSRLNRLLKHKTRHPNNRNDKVNAKIKKCESGQYRK